MNFFDHRQIYLAMLRASRAHKMPMNYRTDLTKHDRAFLRAHDGSPFGWILYDNGTWLVKHGSPYVHTFAVHFTCGTPIPGKESRFYVWDGTAFRNVTREEWIEILTQPLERAS